MHLLGSHPRLTHNELIASAITAFGDAQLSRYEIADFYTAKADDPIQIAVRDRETGRIHLIDLHRNAILDVGALPA